MPAKKKVTKKAGAKARPIVKGKPVAKPAPASKSTSRPAPRADLGVSADGYYAALEPVHKDIAERLRRVVKDAAPKASEVIKWGMPVFEHKGLLCYIQSANGYVKLGFYEQGIYLSDPDGLLEGTGEAMRHVKVRASKDIRAGLFAAWVKRAVELNEDK